MSESKIIYQAEQEMVGKDLRSKQCVICTGKLTVYDRKINPNVFNVTNEIYDSFIAEFMEEKKVFKSNSISDVFGKFSKWDYISNWYFQNGIIFQN